MFVILFMMKTKETLILEFFQEQSEDIPDTWKCSIWEYQRINLPKLLKKDFDEIEIKEIYDKAVNGNIKFFSMRIEKHKSLFDKILFLAAQLKKFHILKEKSK